MSDCGRMSVAGLASAVRKASKASARVGVQENTTDFRVSSYNGAAIVANDRTTKRR